jgi:hydrogenase expression/formation protein HypD
MLRVPGSDPAGGDLLQQRAAGGDVRLLTSPLQALAIAKAHPQRQVVFLAVGFETTAPATALLARQALALKISNLSLLLAHVRVPPAMEAIITAPGNQVQGFLAAGHVCSVMGISELELMVRQHQLPVVVTGFEPLELMQGLLRCVQLLEAGTPRVLNAYKRVVRDGGNPTAQALVEQVFELAPQTWRGLGALPASGLALRPPYHHLDARRRFQLGQASKGESDNPCISGLILQGQKNPVDCPAFGKRCRPEHPLGAPMVSSEGACAAYHHYRP